MKTNNLIAAFFIFIVTITAFVQTAEAQGRRRTRVVKHVVVHPVHRVRHRVVVRRAHVRYAHLPRWGAAVATVPTTAIVVRAHNNSYHFHDGVYYAARNNSFVVVRPVMGVRVRVLPVGFRPVVVAKRNYYYYYGTFYTKVADEYEVVDAPEGAVVDALPDGYEVKKIGDDEYYFLDGVYYAEVEAKEFEDGVGYEVVKVD